MLYKIALVLFIIWGVLGIINLFTPVPGPFYGFIILSAGALILGIYKSIAPKKEA